MEARETADILLRVAQRVRRTSSRRRLTASQWMALRFIACANEVSRTPAALAEFQGTSRGTVSLTIKALLADGYLTRNRSVSDGRSVSLRVTDKGHQILAQDPFKALVQAIMSLDATDRAAMRQTLRRVLAAIASGDAGRLFGLCRECGLIIVDEGSAAPVFECRRRGTAVPPEDLDLLCVNFIP